MGADVHELWDVGTRNVVGAFRTEDEGIDAVRVLLARFGEDYADELHLNRRDGDGVATLLASGTKLAAFATRRGTGVGSGAERD